MQAERQQKLHNLIGGFAWYADLALRVHIANLRMIIAEFPKDIRNAPLSYLLHMTIKGGVDLLVMELAQATDLLDKAIRDLGDTAGLHRTEAVTDLERIRNTLLAHLMEASISGDKDRRWYQEKYGSYDKVLSLLEMALDDLQHAARKTMQRPDFRTGHSSGRAPEGLRREDIHALVDTLRKGGIW